MVTSMNQADVQTMLATEICDDEGMILDKAQQCVVKPCCVAPPKRKYHAWLRGGDLARLRMTRPHSIPTPIEMLMPHAHGIVYRLGAGYTYRRYSFHLMFAFETDSDIYPSKLTTIETHQTSSP